jgi:hypothetical protein
MITISFMPKWRKTTLIRKIAGEWNRMPKHLPLYAKLQVLSGINYRIRNIRALPPLRVTICNRAFVISSRLKFSTYKFFTLRAIDTTECTSSLGFKYCKVQIRED